MHSIRLAQHVKGVLHGIKAIKQRLKVLTCSGISAQKFNFRFNIVSHFTQAQRSGKPCAAFEGVQGAQNFHARAKILRPG